MIETALILISFLAGLMFTRAKQSIRVAIIVVIVLGILYFLPGEATVLPIFIFR